jgi:L-2-hydroxyglutarate oxidase LhgO
VKGSKQKKYDFIIIGGGFYGCALALFLKKKSNSVLVLEREPELLTRASYNNQARVHNGYHYPRSFLTALRSHHNYLRFVEDYKKSVYTSYKQYYAIASIFSKTTSQQFLKFSHQLGSPIKRAPDKVRNLFDKNLIEDVFEVDEIVFNANILREEFMKEFRKNDVDFLLNADVLKIESGDGGVSCILKDRAFVAKKVFNCSYAGINKILINSGMKSLPFKNEFIEMPLIKMSDELVNMSVTVLDGPFFGFLPFPHQKYHSLWHVRYAIRANWIDPAPKDLYAELAKITKKTNWEFMYKDIVRYIPQFRDAKYKESLYEIKTVLISNEENDGRPILYRKNYGIDNFHVVMGGKIDNIYDIINVISKDVV